MKADQNKIIRLLKTARGQIDGVLRMIEDDRYCIDVSNQIMAADAVLRRANREVLHAHMENCVTEAFANGTQEEAQQKMEELYKVLGNFLYD